MSPDDYVGEYEFTDGEGAYYTPSDTERVLILDAIHGYLAEGYEADGPKLTKLPKMPDPAVELVRVLQDNIRLRAADEAAQGLREENEKLRAQVVEFEDNHAWFKIARQAGDDVNRLRAELATANELRDELYSTGTSLQAELAAAQAALTADEAAQGLREENANARTMMAAMEAALGRLGDELAAAQAALAEARADIDDLSTRKVTAELAALRKENERLMEMCANQAVSLRHRIEELTTAQAALAGEKLRHLDTKDELADAKTDLLAADRQRDTHLEDAFQCRAELSALCKERDEAPVVWVLQLSNESWAITDEPISPISSRKRARLLIEPAP